MKGRLEALSQRRLLKAGALLLMGLSLAIFAYACGSGGDGISSSSLGNRETATSPSIQIVAPAGGAMLSGEPVDVEVAIDGFIVDPFAIGKAAVPGRGHWHIYLDGAFINASAVGTVTLDPLPPGPHHIRVALANNDHSPLSPPVEQSIVIEVEGDGSRADGLTFDYDYQ